jgi:hypothetical protein
LIDCIPLGLDSRRGYDDLAVHEMAAAQIEKTDGKEFCGKIHLQVEGFGVNDDLQVHGIRKKIG